LKPLAERAMLPRRIRFAVLVHNLIRDLWSVRYPWRRGEKFSNAWREVAARYRLSLCVF
jgi:hypothetical protein